MMWSKLWPWRAARGRQAPARPSIARLAVEALEDRLVPSSSSDVAYQLWRNQTFHVESIDAVNSIVGLTDPSATAVANVPQNPSFGPLIGLPNVFSNTSYRGAGYSVAIIDTGIDYNNPYLGGGFGPGHRVLAGYDFANNDADPLDDNGHGTHVAGIIGSSSTAYSGVAPDVSLIALKVLDKNGSGTFGAVEDALKWVVANQARYNIVAVNMSLGSGNYTSNPYTFMDAELTTLKSQGVFLSVAAGNSFYSNNSAIGLDFPAVDPLVVSVGAVYSGDFGSVAWASGARDNTTGADRIASFSQRGPALSIMAPGALITSTYLGNTFKQMAGTSMASPVVAGASVLIHQAMDVNHLSANQDTILGLMKATGASIYDGDDENDNVANTGLSFKRLDLGAAIAAFGQSGNHAPVWQPIGNQNVAPGGATLVTLTATDADRDPIAYSVRLIGAGSSQAYSLKQQLGLTYGGSYYPNIWGQNEKWLTSTSGTWYCILPTGELRRWAGSMTSTLSASNLIATLDARYWTDPSLLWNAQPVVGPVLTVVGNTLIVQAPAGVAGSYQVEVSASDGQASAAQTFTLSIQTNSAPQIGAVAGQTLETRHSLTIPLAAWDAQNDAVTFTARIVGTFASAPASLTIDGNQLTMWDPLESTCRHASLSIL